MKINLPPTLNAYSEINHELLAGDIKPSHQVVVRFGDEQIVRVPFTPEQEARVDYYSQWNDETMVEIATETVAGMLRKMWKT